ncbi:MAG: tetratricopeptide repeat protein [Sulfuricellaceae bacterium]
MSYTALEKATVALDGGDHRTAVKLLKSHLKGNPADVPALYLLGAAYQESNRLDEALIAYDRVLAFHAHHFGAHYGKALVLLNRGRHQEAMPHHDAAIRSAPRNFWAWVNRGISKAATGQYAAAIADYDRALSLNPNLPAALTNKGNALTGLGAFDAALACYEQAVALSRQDANAWSNMGGALVKLARHAAAEAACRVALELAPRLSTAWSNLGAALSGLKRHDAAEAACRKALELAPESSAAWSNLGHALYGLKRYGATEGACRKVIELEPHSPEAWSNLGAALEGLKQHDAAEAACRKALELDAHSAEAWRNLSAALCGLKRHDATEAACRKAIELAPSAPEAWNNLGVALSGLKRYDAAEAACRKALELDPDSPTAWSNLGNALYGMKRFYAAAECYEKSLELDADAPFILGGMIHSRMRICDWRDLEQNLARLVREIEQKKCVFHPFPVLGLVANPALQRKAAETYAREKYPLNPVLGAIPKRAKHDKIRLGYYSTDFRKHVLSYLMAGLFECHDKERFELIAFSLGPDTQDEMRQRVSAAFDRFIDVENLSDQEVAKLSRELGIDIAIDLNGYTEGCRTGIFACRAAPLQVNYLGYPGTMGVEYIDYIVADRLLIPVERQRQYAEKMVYLPHSYWPNDAKLEIADKRFSREEVGLPSEGFVFCCFNNNYKITPATFDGWMRILKQVEGAVLWLFEDTPAAAENLKKEAMQRGVAPERLLFDKRLPHAPHSEHFARIRVADLVLDTLPYNAGATASDALWAGVPVLTLIGEAYVGRIAASLLNAIGLPELITTNQEEYEHLAIRLATHPEELKQIREKLAGNRLSTPLFDTVLYARHIEAAYKVMFERYQADLPPEHTAFSIKNNYSVFNI